MRILLAGTSSGCGKTTASLLLMAALRERGLDVAPCKVGPDYIDTGFHELVCGRPSHNLDSFLIEPRDLPTLLSRPVDITVIEGVMGYYDGMDATSCRQSTWEMARLTRTPVLLVVDASGSAVSAAATVKGFMTLREDSGIAGVLVNRVSGAHHYELVRDAVAWAGNSEEAAALAALSAGNILLTTGSHTLSVYAKVIEPERLFVRVLPTHQALDLCAAAGMVQSHVIAMQGPFSRDFNAALYDQLRIRTMVSKDSGQPGGVADKVLPALERGIDVVMIERPKEDKR